MCGICGILQLDPSPDPPTEGLIDRMTATLIHRGPDDHGTWQDNRIALGHRRLSIIDLSRAGRQPMSNEDGTVHITYNGEVYNFKELKDQFHLLDRGHVFRSKTDTEVLVHLYEEIGLDMVYHLNGMFAMALWDSRSDELHLIRDRYGIKPLFYHQDEHCFRFGSEIKAILQDDRVPRRPSIQALHDFLTFDYIPGTQTAFEGISEVPPAHTMTVSLTGGVEVRRYWDLPGESDTQEGNADTVARIEELMDRAVERRLISDVPVGVMLSGGMDSSAIVALTHRHVSDPIHTFSVGFAQATFNELPYARIVADRFKTIAHEVVVTPDKVRDLLPDYLRFIDEPYADGSAIPTYYVCQMAKGVVGVVLSGEGADEIMAGYDTYTAYKVSHWFRRVPRWIRHGLIAPVVRALPVSDKKLSFEFKMKRLLGGMDLEPAEAHLWWRLVMTEVEKQGIYDPRVLEQVTPLASRRHFLDAFGRSNSRDVLNRLMYVDSSVFLPDDLMIKNDRMSMAHSIEARVPFTDPELTEFMARLPAGHKLPGLRKKHLMRQAMRGTLPKIILQKKKVGLEMPYSQWLRDELSDLLVTYCGRDAIADTGLFRASAIEALIEEHRNRRRDHGRALWGLLNYMMWFDMYIR